ncbi:MAG: adaptor protein MecA [Oscillospiraceae bacterium]|nr:adaptor protein MecA [Oscillospiraceae bacterium]
MDFELINEDKLRIRLNPQDMAEAGLVYENMNYSDSHTKRVLLSLLEKAKKQAGFAPRGAKLFIETYETDNKGCDLYFTIIRRPGKLKGSQTVISPVLFEFDSAKELIEGACKVFERYSHRIYKSSLYLLNGKYRLLVYNLDYDDKLSVYFLSEFASKLGEDEVLAAYTMEHGREIILDTAIDMLSKYFG